MLLIGYGREAPAVGGSSATITAFSPQLADNPLSVIYGTSAAHDFTVDVSGLASGTRCLLVGWAWDTPPGGSSNAVNAILASDSSMTTHRVSSAASDGTRKVSLGIYEWTKASQTSLQFTVGHGSPAQGMGFQLFHLANVHASAVTATGTGTSAGSATVSLSAALSTAAGGAALFVAATHSPNPSDTHSWSAGTETADDPVEQYLRLHSATFTTDGSSLNPTLTRDSGTNTLACMAAIALPPA